MSRFLHNTVRWRWGHAAALLALLAAVVFYYFDYLTGQAFIWEDMIGWYFPAATYFCTAVAGGRFPFWLSGLLDGVPLYTDFQSSMYYPFKWLLVLFVRNGELPALPYQWYVVLHILLGGALMYGYLKSHRLRPLSCGLGSLVFCLAGFQALHIIHNPMLKVYAWLPLQLWLVDRAVATRRAKYYGGLTLALWLSLSAGFPQTTLYDSYLLIAYWLYRRSRTLPAESPRTASVVLRHLAGEGWRIAGVFGSVLLLGAVLILPTLEHWRLSVREAMGYAGATAQSLPWRNLIQFAVPNFFGVAGLGGPGVNFWGQDPQVLAPEPRHYYWEFGAYASQLSLIALAAVVCYRRAWRGTPVRFFGISWAIAVWFMLGRYGGLFPVLYHSLPGVAVFRSPARMAGVADCCAAVLVAFVVEAVTPPARLRIGRAVWVVLALYAVGGGLGWAWGSQFYPELRNALTLAAAKAQALLSFQLFLGMAGALWLLRGRPPAVRWAGGGLLALLLFADLHQAYGFFHRGKVNPDQYFDTNLWIVEAHAKYVRQHGPVRLAQFEDGRSGQCVVDRNLPLIETSLETSQGYFDLMLRDTARLRQLTNPTALLDLQNVGMVAQYNTRTRRVLAEFRPCLPRVKFYPAVRRYDSDAAILRDLDAGTLDYRQTVAVSAAEFPTAYHGTIAATDRVTFIPQTPEDYQIQYHVSSPGIIFVSENHYPGWEVTDESGHKLQLIRAFVAFKGIVLPQAGQGTLTVRFRPGSFQVGAAITGVTALGLMIFYGGQFLREQRPPRVAPAPVRSRRELVAGEVT